MKSFRLNFLVKASIFDKEESKIVFQISFHCLQFLTVWFYRYTKLGNNPTGGDKIKNIVNLSLTYTKRSSPTLIKALGFPVNIIFNVYNLKECRSSPTTVFQPICINITF